MIVFVIRSAHQYTVRTTLETQKAPTPFAPIVLSYREFLRLPSLPIGDYIFADLERLKPEVIAATSKRLEHLQRLVPSLRVLNSPSTELQRLTVMGKLYTAGLQSFRVFPATELVDDIRFPVFLRKANDHAGPTSGLLIDHKQLQSAISRESKHNKSLNEVLVTEYVDTRDQQGMHRKLSYFRIADRYFPGAFNVGSNWVLKGVADPDESPEVAEERMSFLKSNPHEFLLRPYFETAGVEYGRVDYAMVDGKVEVFEINTNPMLATPQKLPAYSHDFARVILNNWFLALNEFSPSPPQGRPNWQLVPRVAMHESFKFVEERVPIIRSILRAVLGKTNQLHLESRMVRPLRKLKIIRQ